MRLNKIKIEINVNQLKLLSLLEGAVLEAVQHGFSERPGPEFMALELLMCSASLILLLNQSPSWSIFVVSFHWIL